MKTHLQKRISTFFLLMVISFTGIISLANASNYYSRTSGDWTSNTTWSTSSGGGAVSVGVYPVAGDIVYIERGKTVTVNSDAVCASIYFTNVTSSSSTLTILGTNSLTVSGLISMIRPSSGYVQTINVNEGTLVAGSLTMSATTSSRNNIINISTGNVTISGGTTTGTTGCQFNLSNSGILEFGGLITGTPSITTVTGSTVIYSRSGTQTVIGTTYSNLILSGNNVKTTTRVAVNGILSMEGSATASALPSYGSNATLQYKGNAAQTTGAEFPTSFNGTGGVIIDNTNGVTLSAAKTIGTASKLILVNGNITSTTTNLLSISNTATNAIVGGSATSYINGPIKWSLPANLNDGSTFIFPVGGGSTYLPFVLDNPTTGTGTITAQGQAVSGNSGGGMDVTLASKSNSEYWILNTSGNFTDASVSLNKLTSIEPFDVIGGSSSLTGTYTSLIGTPDIYGISNSNPIGSNHYFVLAQKRAVSITTSPISTTSYCQEASVSIPFTITGMFTSGNVFTAQLSNSTGSFASAINIGTLTSTGSGTISATIPAGTASGSGYRIRIVSNNPDVIGTDNGSNLTINDFASTPVTTRGFICIGSSSSVTLSASEAVSGEKYKWYNAANGGTLLKTSTDNNDNTYTTVVLSSTTNYWVSIINGGGCESPRVQVTATSPSASTDDQNAAGNDSWIGHVYDNINLNTYYGSYTEPETFDQSFGGGTQTCFNITSNSASLSIYTETYSVRYRMNSTKKGLYVVDLGSDDGSRLTVDGTIVYNNWSDQSFNTRPRVLMSLTGSSSLAYDFYENLWYNRVIFQNLVLVLANNLTKNTSQSFCQGTNGATIIGDAFGTLPTGISVSGTGYQWTYSTSPSGTRIPISGATGATFTPTASTAPFNVAGTYYIYRNATLSSTNNINPNPYAAKNESNGAIIIVNPLPTKPESISGNISPDQDSTEIYSVANILGETYDWTFPTDWKKTAGESTNPVTVTVGLNSGNIQVTANNLCGSSEPTILAVTVVSSIDLYPDTIVWTDRAKDGDWDNYANWVNPTTKKQLNSKTKFKEDLTVIFPSPETIKRYESELGIIDSSVNIVNYPEKKDPKKIKVKDNLFMKNIKIEYGASLKIGSLLNKYTTAEVEMEIADRNEWILVGPNIKPIDGGTERSVMSGDYYLNQEPQVYMSEMTLDANNETNWSRSFGSLTETISSDRCFAIRIPDQYGKYKVSGAYYYRKNPTKPATIGKDPVKYTFKGKFQNEITTPTISTISGQFVVACNTFMANISAKKFLDIFGGQISVWSFNENSDGKAQMGSFATYNSKTVPADLYIKPMQAYMYLDETTRIITLNEDDICDINASTKYRAKAPVSENPTLQIIASNGNYSSKMSIIYDEDLADGAFNFNKDIVKLFSGYAQTPDMFSYLGLKRLQSQTINNLNEVVNLGIKIGVLDTVKLCIIGVDQFEAVFLVDKQTNTSYELSGDTAKIDLEVLAGTNSDRFYVKFEPAPGIVTNVNENTNEAALKIYTEDNQHVIVSNAEYTKVTEISIVDMSSNITRIIPSNDSYNVIDMSNYPAGVYAVKALTGTDAKTEKIIIR